MGFRNLRPPQTGRADFPHPAFLNRFRLRHDTAAGNEEEKLGWSFIVSLLLGLSPSPHLGSELISVVG